jgi:hypothetical protein
MPVTTRLGQLTTLLAVVSAVPLLAGDEAAVSRRTSAGVHALAESRYTPAEFVNAALGEAAVGDVSLWDQFLSKAIEADPDFAPARWQAGYLRDDDRWLTIDQAIQSDRDSELLASYRRVREANPDTVAGQLKVARWCVNNGLRDESITHFNQVLLKEPNNSAAHTGLGDKLVRGTWVNAEALELSKRRQQFVRDSILRWSTELTQIRMRLEDNDQARRDMGRNQLIGIADRDVIPAMERILSLHSDVAASEVLNALNGIDEPEATLSIVRHALLCSSPDIRDTAIELLKRRPSDHFVPALIATLRGPIQSQYLIGFRLNGLPICEHVLFREGFDVDERTVYDVTYRLRGGGLPRAMRGIDRDIAARESAIDVQNGQNDFSNRRIIAILSTVTGQDIGADPYEWWQWWTGYNGLETEGKKPVGTQYYAYTRCECFVAGTPVWTSSGPVPIERVKVGDRVLAQDPESGELAFKCVVTTTVRPPSPIVTITANDESIGVTEGHPFWVNGSGWVLAKAINEGACLFSVGGGCNVQSNVSDLERQSAYNLIVSDFHTYFVGNHKLLVHDSTTRKPTNAKVPGMR